MNLRLCRSSCKWQRLASQPYRDAAIILALFDTGALEQIEASHRAGALEFGLQRFRERGIGFHQGIADATHNPFFTSTVATTLRPQNWAVDVAVSGTPGSLLIAVIQHEAILEAIRNSHLGHRASVEPNPLSDCGIVTSLELQPNCDLSVRYAFGLISTLSGFGRVTDIRSAPDGIVLEDTEGRTVHAVVNLDFITPLEEIT